MSTKRFFSTVVACVVITVVAGHAQSSDSEIKISEYGRFGALHWVNGQFYRASESTVVFGAVQGVDARHVKLIQQGPEREIATATSHKFQDGTVQFHLPFPFNDELDKIFVIVCESPKREPEDLARELVQLMRLQRSGLSEIYEVLGLLDKFGWKPREWTCVEPGPDLIRCR